MATTKQQLMDQWLLETDPERREVIIQEMMKNALFPDDKDYEDSYGLYPDLEDPNFIQKLFNKREFGENKTDSIQYQIKMNLNSCDTNVEFEVSPLQRFVKNFLSGKTPYNSALLYHGVGVGKCHGKDTPILMYDGSIKKIQDIEINDVLMGDDSTPRNVLSLARGRDMMFEIKTVKGDSYIVNSEHILSLKYTGTHNIIDVPLDEYLKFSNKRKSNLKGYSTGVEFKSKKITFDPYILGVWLGDGSQRDPVISSQDSKILHYLREYSSNNNLSLNYQSGYDYRISSFSRKEENTFFTFLKDYNLINNKHIPNDYKINDRNVRLQVLAGLIDTDGYLIHGTYEITQKSKELMDDIIFLARSLGFMTTTKRVSKSCTYKNNIISGYYYRTFISGDIHTIPVKIERKKASIRKQKKDVLKYGFDVIELGEDDYYGFTLDGNNRYVLGNFIVTHNTCAAIGIAEANLHYFPNKKVFIIAPPNIQPNFERTIFDVENVSIPKEVDVPNTHSGCTGNLYLELTGTEYEKDRRVIEKKVKKLIRSRYEIMGYLQLYSYVQKLINSVPQMRDLEERDQRIQLKIQKEFSNHCMIIDEAHNLRDIPTMEEEDNLDIPGGEVELSDSQQGKKLTPILKKILNESDSMKLVLLTATPMYNSYLEIFFLLNLLLINDKRAIIREKDIFKDNKFSESGKKLFGSIVRNYISFMRGETPLTFPTRLKPLKVPRIEKWYSAAPNREAVKLTDNQYNGLLELPLVPVSFPEKTYNDYTTIFELSIEKQKMSLASVDTMIQSGNWLFPSTYDTDIEDRIRDTGFDNCFKTGSEYSTKSAIRYKSTIEPPSWLVAESSDGLVNHSPKAAFIVNSIRKSEGVIFIYSRFIKSGALPLALALEANGYTPYGRDRPMLVDGNQISQGRQCAKCSKREKEHMGVEHKFTPAKYVLLTGRKDLSPNNTASILAERAKTNFDGSDVKVVIGSEVASEGIDLKYVREIYVFDSWYHLNRMEQVLGRGIRTCSHALLPEEKRNCTIYLLVNVLKDERESADVYMYRRAMIKSQEIGNVTRFIKQHALDCNLNIDVNIIRGLEDRLQVDAQQNKRSVVLNDEAYTNMCDWMDCDYNCAEPVDIDPNNLDNLTYDDYTAQWRENQIKSKIRALFQSASDSKGLMMIPAEKMTDIFSGIPSEALFTILHDIVNNRSFRIKVNDKEGYITYKNGYYLFQPIKLQDLEIPLALRSADYPIKQDVFHPVVEEKKPITKEVVVQEDEVEKREESKFFKQFWNEAIKWCSKIQEGSAELKLPSILKTGIENKFSTNVNIKTEILEKLDMIIWLYRSRSLSENEEYRLVLSYVALEFIWDYCLTFNEQIELSKEKDDVVIQKVAVEHLLRNNVFRFVSSNPPFNMMYWCDTKMCDQIVVDMMEKDTTEKYSTLKANIETTGPYYGFLVPKNSSIFTFKLVGINSRVAEVNSVPPTGAECKGIQTKAPKLEVLYKLAEYLKDVGLPDFDLNRTVLENTKERVPKNTNAYCALIEFMLRWMDIKKVKNRRWFYRPISAYKTKHYTRGAKIKK